MSEPTPQELSIAEAFGRLAARKGKGTRACPYEANGDAKDRVLTARFVHAFFEAGGTSEAGAVDPVDEPEPGPGRAVAIGLGIATGAGAAYAWHRARERRG